MCRFAARSDIVNVGLVVVAIGIRKQHHSTLNTTWKHGPPLYNCTNLAIIAYGLEPECSTARSLRRGFTVDSETLGEVGVSQEDKGSTKNEPTIGPTHFSSDGHSETQGYGGKGEGKTSEET